MRTNGIEIERYNIVYDESPFIENEIVSNLLGTIGIDGLPIIIVDDEVAMFGRYPSRTEFAKLLGIPRSILVNQKNFGGSCRCI